MGYEKFVIFLTVPHHFNETYAVISLQYKSGLKRSGTQSDFAEKRLLERDIVMSQLSYDWPWKTSSPLLGFVGGRSITGAANPTAVVDSIIGKLSSPN